MSAYDPRAAALEVYAPAWALVAIRTLDTRLTHLPGVLFPKAAPAPDDQAFLHGIAAALDELVSLPPAVRRLLWTDGPWAEGWRWDRDLAKAWLAMSAGTHDRDLDLDTLRERAVDRQTHELYDRLWRVPDWTNQPPGPAQLAAAYTALHDALQSLAPAESEAALGAWLAESEDPGTAWGTALGHARKSLTEAGMGAPRG